MSVAFVQSRSRRDDLKTLAFNSNVTSGNLLVVAINSAGASVTNVTDSQGNTYTQAAEQSNASIRVAVWYAFAGSSSANTVTLTTTSANLGFAIHEYSGVDDTTPLVSFAKAGGTGTAVSSGVCTVTAADSLLFGVWGGWQPGTFSSTPDAALTARESGHSGVSWIGLFTADDLDADAAAAADFTASTSVGWLAVAVSFGPDSPFIAEPQISDTLTFSQEMDTGQILNQGLAWSSETDAEGFDLPEVQDGTEDSLSFRGRFVVQANELSGGRYRR